MSRALYICNSCGADLFSWFDQVRAIHDNCAYRPKGTFILAESQSAETILRDILAEFEPLQANIGIIDIDTFGIKWRDPRTNEWIDAVVPLGLANALARAREHLKAHDDAASR